MYRTLLYLLSSFLLTGCHSRGLERLLAEGHHTGSSLESTEPIVILVAGQSNAVALANSPADYVHSTTGKVSVVFHGVDEGAPTVAHPIANSITWVKLGDMLAQRTGREVRIINVAIGATNSNQWATTFLHYITDSVEQYNPDVVIWVQGENDTFSGLTEEQSYQNYRKILDAANGTPFYVSLDGFIIPGLDKEPVRRAQSRIIAEGNGLLGADIDELREDRGNMDPPGIHFQGKGFDAHAIAWFNILSEVL